MTPTSNDKNIHSYSPSPLPMSNHRNSGEILQNRQRIRGQWSHNRFINYSYVPSEAYFKKLLKFRMPQFTKKLK